MVANLLLPSEKLPNPWANERANQTGLAPIEANAQFVIDNKYFAQYQLRKHLLTHSRHSVFVSNQDELTTKAKHELLAFVMNNLSAKYPRYFHLDTKRNAFCNLLTEDVWTLPVTEDPLVVASLLVQEDLVLLMPADDGYKLAAGVVYFPSHWDVTEKFRLPLREIHAHVPHYQKSFVKRVDKVFEGLPADPAFQRHSWFVYTDIKDEFELHSPRRNTEKTGPAGVDVASAAPGIDDLMLRIEQQTITRLPSSNYVLFSIHSFQQPARLLEHEPGALRDFSAALGRMDPLRFKYVGAAVFAPVLTSFAEEVEKKKSSRL